MGLMDLFSSNESGNQSEAPFLEYGTIVTVSTAATAVLQVGNVSEPYVATTILVNVTSTGEQELWQHNSFFGRWEQLA